MLIVGIEEKEDGKGFGGFAVTRRKMNEKRTVLIEVRAVDRSVFLAVDDDEYNGCHRKGQQHGQNQPFHVPEPITESRPVPGEA